MVDATSAPLPATGRRLDCPSEFRGRTLLIAGAMLGLIVSMPTVLGYSFGVFITAFEKDYGWSRASMSLSMSFFAAALFLGSALVGKIADRVGAGCVAAWSMLAFGVSLLLVPYIVHDVRSLWVAYVFASFAGLGTTPVVLLKPVVAAFSERRGIAIGLTLCGIGVGASLAPQFANVLVEAGGWKLGYIGLGCFAVVCAPLLWLTLSLQPRTSSSSPPVEPRQEAEGLTLLEASKLRTFWLLSAISLLGIFGVSGIVAHLIPFLRDHAASASTAAGFASLLGLASIAGRVGTGVALDRFRGPVVGSLFLGSGALGALLLALYDIPFAIIGVLLVGVALGSEIDLMAYFVSRYFGLRYHGAIFGWNYGMVSLGSMSSPFLLGALRDREGGYDLGLAVMIGALATAALLCLLLGGYRYAVHATVR